MSNLDAYLDQIPTFAVLAGCFGLMILGVEVGFRCGALWLGTQAKAQASQVRALMGAGLGLLGFMLAFSYSIAQSHYELRTQAYLEEISAITSSFLSASFLMSAEDTAKAQDLLRQFVDNRVEIIEHQSELEEAGIYRLIAKGEQIHEQLWLLGQVDEVEKGGNASRRFSESVIRMIEANEQRKQASIYNRISPVIWVTLILMSALAMLVTGYQAGLTGSRSRLATWSLAMTFAAIMALVIDLDRPRMSLFQINQQQMYDLQKNMATSDHLSVSPIK
jgi:hypothetical protein